jgi:formylglycine-generating enzyme required for sulfatase activity
MWAKNANLTGKCMLWEEAKKYVSTLDYGDYRDWRLPTNEELESMAKFGEPNPADGLNELDFQVLNGIIIGHQAFRHNYFLSPYSP